MRRLVVVILVVMQCAAAAGEELEREKIRIIGPVFKIVTRERLTDLCRIDGNHISACTLFVGYRLEGSCRAKGMVWRAEALARFTPLVYLGELKSMAHERDHIEDVRVSLSQYLELLERREFSSFDKCHHAMVQEADGFKERLREFARESTRKRDPNGILAAEAPRLLTSK